MRPVHTLKTRAPSTWPESTAPCTATCANRSILLAIRACSCTTTANLSARTRAAASFQFSRHGFLGAQRTTAAARHQAAVLRRHLECCIHIASDRTAVVGSVLLLSRRSTSPTVLCNRRTLKCPCISRPPTVGHGCRAPGAGNPTESATIAHAPLVGKTYLQFVL